MAHTLGPWWIEEFRSQENRYVIYEIMGRIAVAEGACATAEANARLIAAAPELLDALKRCVQWLSDLDNDICEKAELLNAMDAIAKAEGVTMEDKHGPQN